MSKIEFEWDNKKAASNLKKHGVSFDLAVEIFSQPLILSFEDDRFNYNEVREVAISQISGICLYVVFTLRSRAIRIISARKASAKEQGAYYDYIERTAVENFKKNE